MKDYYKILKVKETATEEEIREKWIKLMRKLHPDLRVAEATEDKRIKEINEAYQVLKFSSTRAQYDLKRAYDRKKRRAYSWRLSFPIGILIVFLIIGTVIFRSSINPKNVKVGMNVINVPNVLKEPNGLNVPNGPNVLNSPSVNASTHNHIVASKHSRTASTQPRIDSSTPPPLSPRNASPALNDQNSLNVPNDLNEPSGPTVPNDLTVTASTQPRVDASTPPPLSPPNPSPVPNDKNEPNVPNDLTINLSTHSRVVASPSQAIAVSTPQPIAASSSQLVAASSPQPPIATQQEVEQFLANYTKRYTQKDLDDFLSLFSSKAIQNHRDGLKQIRTIYKTFFNQSEGIQYDMEGIKMEIYQNGVEIKARYKVVQLLKRSGEKIIWKGDIRWRLVKEDGALKILFLDYQPEKSN
jgi:hypothetical protein